MRGYSKNILIGNLGSDPVLRHTPGGIPVVTVTLATNKVWYDEQKNKKESTEWHKVVIWRRGAEIASQYLKKGSPLFVDGENHTRSYVDKNKVTRYVTEVHANEIRLIGGKPEMPSGNGFDTEAPVPAEAGNTEVTGDVSEYI